MLPSRLSSPSMPLAVPLVLSWTLEMVSPTVSPSMKGNLQWERDIPPEALASLEALAAQDFIGNLGKIIHDTYQTARLMFCDMPQGDHKKRAKYRFASKTLMRILPEKMKVQVEDLIEKKEMTLDLYEILGQCTWGQTKIV